MYTLPTIKSPIVTSGWMPLVCGLNVLANCGVVSSKFRLGGQTWF